MEMNIDTVNALNLKLNAVSDMYNTIHNRCANEVAVDVKSGWSWELFELCMTHQTNLLIAMF